VHSALQINVVRYKQIFVCHFLPRCPDVIPKEIAPLKSKLLQKDYKVRNLGTLHREDRTIEQTSKVLKALFFKFSVKRPASVSFASDALAMYWILWKVFINVSIDKITT
jgi:hypothetical protein